MTSTGKPLKFAVLGLDHAHVLGLIRGLTEAGAEFAGLWSETDTKLTAGVAERAPEVLRVADPRQLLEDPSIELVVTAAVPARRAEISVEALRHGKDVVADKPARSPWTSWPRCARRWRSPAGSGRWRSRSGPVPAPRCTRGS